MYYRNRGNEVINLSKVNSIFIENNRVIAGFDMECIDMEEFDTIKKATNFVKWISKRLYYDDCFNYKDYKNKKKHTDFLD